MLTYQIIAHQTTWDQTLAALPTAHVLQSWAWGDFKSHWGWSVQRLLWTDSDAPVAAAQLLRRPIPRSPWSFIYVSKGPALDYGNIVLVEQVLADLEAFARHSRALFIKIDPDVPRQFGEARPDQLLESTGLPDVAIVWTTRFQQFIW